MIIYHHPEANLLPGKSGTYLIGLTLPKKRKIMVGRLGCFDFEPGHYFYLGSARGPGGLKSRVGRHLRRASSKHWHIDYLKRDAHINQIWFTFDNVEHQWAELMAEQPNITAPVPGFGASDCSCVSHLLFLTSGRVEPTICRVNTALGNMSN